MNWLGSLGKRMDHPGRILIKNAPTGPMNILGTYNSQIQNSYLSSQVLHAVRIPNGSTSSFLVLCQIHIHQRGVEVETDPLMIQTFLIVDSGGMAGEQATGSILKSPILIHVGYGIHRN